MNHPINIQLIAPWLSIEKRVVNIKRLRNGKACKREFTDLIALALTNWSTYKALRHFPIVIGFPMSLTQLDLLQECPYWKTGAVTLKRLLNLQSPMDYIRKFESPNLASVTELTLNDIALINLEGPIANPIPHVTRLTINRGFYSSPSFLLKNLKELSLNDCGYIELYPLAQYPALEKLRLAYIRIIWSHVYQSDLIYDTVNNWPRLQYICLRNVTVKEPWELFDLFRPCVPGKRILTTLESEYWMQRL